MSLINIKSTTSLASFSHNFDVYGDYLYFERNTKVKPSCYENILAIARNRIIIVDPYFSIDEDPELFEKVGTEGIDIKILSVCTDRKRKEDVMAYYDAIKDTLKKNLTTFNLSVHCFKPKPYIRKRSSMWNYEDEEIFLWHDRYLVIDDRAFLVGSSMNNQVTGEKSFGIYEVKDGGTMADFIIDLYDDYTQKVVYDKNGWYKKP